MHVYHYNHTERSSLERLTLEHGVAELELERLIADGDVRRPVPGDHGVDAGRHRELRPQARWSGWPDYERGHEIDRGAGAVVEYERWMADRDDQAISTAIAAYNEDDVRATRAVRDWLVEQRRD